MAVRVCEFNTPLGVGLTVSFDCSAELGGGERSLERKAQPKMSKNKPGLTIALRKRVLPDVGNILVMTIWLSLYLHLRSNKTRYVLHYSVQNRSIGKNVDSVSSKD